jgi:predicted DNA-binding transcriptional regulator AlpA
MVGNGQEVGRKFVRFPGLRDVLGFTWTRAHIITLTKRGEFPVPYKLSANRVGWDLDELLAWKAARERAFPARKKSRRVLPADVPRAKPGPTERKRRELAAAAGS